MELVYIGRLVLAEAALSRTVYWNRYPFSLLRNKSPMHLPIRTWC